jgi:nucleoside-diphosphate-sugar epimerase
LALAIAWVCDMVCTPLGLRPPLSRFGVYIMGRDYDVDTALTRKQLGWKTKVPYEEAMKRIGKWVKEVYLKQ